MALSNSEFNLYVDTMIVQALLDDNLVKNANEGSFIMPLINKVKEYVFAHIDSKDKVGSVINFLAPGAITLMLDALGFKWIGKIAGLLASMFHIDVASIIGSIYNKIKSLLTSGEKVTSSQIDSAVKSAASEHVPTDMVDDHKTYAETIRDIRILKLALIDFESSDKLTKNAAILSPAIASKAINVFTTVIGWIFKTVLASAGLMAAGDVANKLVGRSNALDGSLEGGKPSPKGSTPSEGGGFWAKLMGGGGTKSDTPEVSTTSTQTKFKVNPSYVDVKKNTSSSNWLEQGYSNQATVEAMVVNFAKEVYSGLDNLDSVIKSTANFRNVVNMILNHNRTRQEDPGIYIPRTFVSKKQMVDYFIDEVAAKA